MSAVQIQGNAFMNGLRGLGCWQLARGALSGGYRNRVCAAHMAWGTYHGELLSEQTFRGKA